MKVFKDKIELVHKMSKSTKEEKPNKKRIGIKDTIVASTLPNGNRFTSEGDCILNIFVEKKIWRIAFVCKFCCRITPDMRANSYQERDIKVNSKKEKTKGGCGVCYTRYTSENITISKEYMEKYVNTKEKAEYDVAEITENSSKKYVYEDTSKQYNEFVKLLENDEHTLLTDSKEYKSKTTKCEIKCDNGHIFNMSYHAYKTAKRRRAENEDMKPICPDCDPSLSIEDQKKHAFLAEQGTDKLLSKFTKVNEVMDFECIRPFHPKHIEKIYKSNWNNYTNKNTPIRCACVSTDLRHFEAKTINDELPIKYKYIFDYNGIKFDTVDKSTKMMDVTCKKCDEQIRIHMNELFESFKCPSCNP